MTGFLRAEILQVFQKFKTSVAVKVTTPDVKSGCWQAESHTGYTGSGHWSRIGDCAESS